MWVAHHIWWRSYLLKMITMITMDINSEYNAGNGLNNKHMAIKTFSTTAHFTISVNFVTWKYICECADWFESIPYRSQSIQMMIWIILDQSAASTWRMAGSCSRNLSIATYVDPHLVSHSFFNTWSGRPRDCYNKNTNTCCNICQYYTL